MRCNSLSFVISVGVGHDFLLQMNLCEFHYPRVFCRVIHCEIPQFLSRDFMNTPHESEFENIVPFVELRLHSDGFGISYFHTKYFNVSELDKTYLQNSKKSAKRVF